MCVFVFVFFTCFCVSFCVFLCCFFCFCFFFWGGAGVLNVVVVSFWMKVVLLFVVFFVGF